MTTPLHLSINDAAQLGVKRLRISKWSAPEDHIQIDIFEGGVPGPWVHLYAPFNTACNGADPQNMLCTMFDYDAREWEVYRGPLPSSEEYQRKVAAYGPADGETKL